MESFLFFLLLLSFFKLLQFSFSQEQEKIIDWCQVSLGLCRNLGKMESWWVGEFPFFGEYFCFFLCLLSPLSEKMKRCIYMVQNRARNSSKTTNGNDQNDQGTDCRGLGIFAVGGSDNWTAASSEGFCREDAAVGRPRHFNRGEFRRFLSLGCR